MKYYLHDTNSFSDEKITQLFIKFGYEGVGLFYVILEKLAFQEKPVLESVLKTQLQIRKRLQKQLDFMYEIDLLSLKNGEVFNKNILKNTEKYQEKKKKNAKRISEWREKQTDTENVTCYESVRNTDKVSKVKESKVNNKESKEQIKNLPPTKTLKEIKDIKTKDFKNEMWEVVGKLNGDQSFWTNNENSECKKFCDYWTESKPKGKKIKWELQQTFDISKRMTTWKNNNYQKSNEKKQTGEHPTILDMVQGSPELFGEI